jgi:Cof subfamily protein (haloacid dehalogenase superfamily)
MPGITARKIEWSVPIRLIAMDIDGTLLDSRGQIPDENSKAIAEAAERGIEILLVTGRRFNFALPVAESLPCDVKLIVNNGALAKSRDGLTHLRFPLPVTTARAVIESTPELTPCASVVFDRPMANQVIMEKIDWDHPFRGGYFRRNSEYLAEVSPLVNCLNGEDPIQVMYVGNCAPLRQAIDTLKSLPESQDFELSLTEYLDRDLSILDVLRQGVTKGMALAEWTRLRGIAQAEVMAIGDNWNDREMLDFAGQPVLMGNAVPDLRAHGWPVTLSNDENGVAEAIRRYALK